MKLSSILLIDDDPVNNYLINHLFRRMGKVEDVVVMKNGMLALEYLEQCTKGKTIYPDLILLDLNMPGISGLEFLEALHGLCFQISRTRIVPISNSFRAEDYQKLAEFGLKEVIIKPLTMEKIRSLMNLSQEL